MIFIYWYITGLISTAVFIFILYKICRQHLTYGDVAFCILVALGGPLSTLALIITGFAWVLWELGQKRFWKKVIFKKDYYYD